MTATRLWVIGDIHGMFDPLNRLLRQIRLLEQEKDGDCTIIFLGDYIDYGPSSKEVLDTLIRLKYEFHTVFLAGNHEDLMLQFLRSDDIYQRFGNVWFRGNDGHVTVASLTDDPKLLARVFASDAAKMITPEDVQLDPKYRRFLDTLCYAHTEELQRGEHTLRLAFCHGLLHNPEGDESDAESANDGTVEEQLALRSYDQFHKFRKDHDFWIEDLHVWNRNGRRGRYGEFVLIHGHTPTVLLPRYYGDIAPYKPESGLPHLRFTMDGVNVVRQRNRRLTVDATLGELAAIDIDTGVVYGKCLTALLIDTEELFQTYSFSAYQVHMDRPHRHGDDVSRTTFQFLP